MKIYIYIYIYTYIQSVLKIFIQFFKVCVQIFTRMEHLKLLQGILNNHIQYMVGLLIQVKTDSTNCHKSAYC